MDHIPSNQVQNVHTGIGIEFDQVLEDCLNNSVIVRKIFHHFSSTELLQLSLVNKIWNLEARTEIRKRGNIKARILCADDQPCRRNVEGFLSVIRRMTVAPFFEISIQVTTWRHTCERLDGDPFHDVSLHQLQSKKISIELFGKWWEFDNCPGLVLVKKLLQDCSGNHEELSLKIVSRREEFMEKIVRECRFPRLKILKLQESCGVNHEVYMNYIKGLVSRAPKLEQLQTEGPLNSMLAAVEGSSAVVLYQHTVGVPFKEILQTALGALRLENMELFYCGPEFNNLNYDFDQLNRFTPMLLKTSCTTTLRSMVVNAVLAVPLMCYSVCLEKVTDLDVYINYRHLEQTEPWILRTLKDFDFTRIFPKLRKVKICGDHAPEISPDVRDVIIAQARAVLREPMPDRAAFIKEVCFDDRNLSTETTQYFSEMFPNIEKLEVMVALYEKTPFGSIWKHWPDLKELKVEGSMRATGNLDSVFCGLFPEEVAELRDMDDDFLKKVNIVPVMPAITCLRNLRALTLNHQAYAYHAFDDGPTFMFSKVTVLTAFARYPALGISLNITSSSDPPEMTHLKPYVSVNSFLIE